MTTSSFSAPGEPEGEADTPFIRHLTQLAEVDPDRPCLTVGAETLTRRGLIQAAEQLALDYQERGIQRGDTVALVLPNSAELVVALVATWKLGATPVPLSDRLGRVELLDVLKLAAPKLVHGWTDTGLGDEIQLVPPGYEARLGLSGDLDPDVVSPVWKGIASGGSTGKPKIIMANSPSRLGEMFVATPIGGMRSGDTCVLPGPLSHNGPFYSLISGLRVGAHIVLPLGRFDPEGTLRLLADVRAEYLYTVPTMMLRMLRVDNRLDYDISALRTVIHMGAPCPPSVKRAWIEWVGAERVLEMYTSTEALALFQCDGREWLERPGTVGRAKLGEVEIRTASGEPAPIGQVGRIWARRSADGPAPYRYLGAVATHDEQNWESNGDMGRIDADGYLYLADRETDMLLVGGSNVYPAEVEAAIIELDAVQDVCVIGLPDEEMGQLPHAIVYATTPLEAATVIAAVKERLAPYKAPRSVEFVTGPLRDQAGKVRRRTLIAERTQGRSKHASTEEVAR